MSGLAGDGIGVLKWDKRPTVVVQSSIACQ